jgi:hypothetical protein
MVRLPAATASSPEHGQPGQTPEEDGVQTPCTRAVNMPGEKAIKKHETRGEGKVERKGLTSTTRQILGRNDLSRRNWIVCARQGSQDGRRCGDSGGVKAPTSPRDEAHTVAPVRWADIAALCWSLNLRASSEGLLLIFT